MRLSFFEGVSCPSTPPFLCNKHSVGARKEKNRAMQNTIGLAMGLAPVAIILDFPFIPFFNTVVTSVYSRLRTP